MMQLTDATGLAGVAFAVSALVVCALGAKWTTLTRLLAVLFLMILMWLPIWDLHFAGYVRGYLGDLSVTSLLLLGAGLSRQTLRGRPQLLILLGVTALFFYPLALGLTTFDPYRLGFGGFGLTMGLLIVVLWAFWQRHDAIVLSISLALLAWALGWSESRNIWDYVFDVWLALFAVGTLVHGVVKRLKAHD